METKANSTEQSGNQSLIFLVDDNPIYMNILKSDLEKIPNIIVMTFNTGEECLKYLHLKPRIVVLDYDLRNEDFEDTMNGIEVLKMIKEQSEEIEVIMLSGMDKINVATSSIKYGAYDYVVKNQNAFFNLKHRIFKLFEMQHVFCELQNNKRVTWAIVATISFIVVIPILLFAIIL